MIDENSTKEEVLEAVRKNAVALSYASKQLQGDPEIVMEAIKQCGCALEDASEEIKSEKRIIMAMVKENGEALMYASKKLKADKEIIAEAILNLGVDKVLIAYSNECQRNWEWRKKNEND